MITQATVKAGMEVDSAVASELHLVQPRVKNEVVDDNDYFGNGDDEEETYKPRPQLPKPHVGLRSLADLIRERIALHGPYT